MLAGPVPVDLNTLQDDFPVLKQSVHGHPLCYLDNAATTQLPLCVISAMREFLSVDNANTHGRIHLLSERSQQRLEQGRQAVADFLGASHKHEIVFVPGATYGLNLVAQGYFAPRLTASDTVLVSVMEHHSNFVPWQQLCQQTGATLEVIGIDAQGQLDLEALQAALTKQPAVLALTHVSNVLGTINPIEKICTWARQAGVPVVIDGAQAAGHLPVNVQTLGADFYVFSGHKMYAPTGIGVVYARASLWQTMQPWVLGGGMVERVSASKVSFAAAPEGFEAGTKNVLGVVGLNEAIQYTQGIGLQRIAAHEQALAHDLYSQLAQRDYITLLGGEQRTGVVSFTVRNAHPHDIVMLLDQQGVAARGGHHCAQPLMQHFAVPACTRFSSAVYTSKQEIDRAVRALDQVCEVLHV